MDSNYSNSAAPEAFSRTAEEVASNIVRIRSALALFRSSAKPNSLKTVREEASDRRLGLALANLDGL